jgi:hypothetical protein
MFNYSCIVIITIAVLVAFLNNYKKGILVSVFFLVLMPSYADIQINTSLPAITIQRIIIVIMLFFWFGNRKYRLVNTRIKYLIPLVFLALSMGISMVMTESFLVSGKQYLFYLFEYLLVFIIFRTSIDDIEYLKKIVMVVSLSLTVIAVIAILERYFGLEIAAYFPTRATYDFMRIDEGINYEETTSVLTHRILFGAVMAIGVVFNMYMMLNSRRKVIFFILTFLNFLGLYYSASRGPWLAFFFSSVMMVVLFPKKHVTIYGILTIVMIMTLLINNGVYSSISGLLESTLDPTTVRGSSYQWRYQVWNMAIQQITSGDIMNLLFGYGQGMHMYKDFGTITLSSGWVTQFRSWDNEFAILLYCFGIIGLFLELILYLYFFLTSFRYIFSKNTYQNIMFLAVNAVFVIALMKTNVAIFSVQVGYIECLSFAISSALQSWKIVAKTT